MRRSAPSLRLAIASAGLAVLAVSFGSVAIADGTETLGPPVGITIASGTGVIAAGTGLAAGQPGTININVPGTVQQALLYWTEAGGPSGNSVYVDPGSGAVNFTGTTISGPVPTTPAQTAHRADITSVVSAGSNTLAISGLTDLINWGAGVLVIYDDGSGSATIDIRDGLDTAYHADPPPLTATIPQTFVFPPAAGARVATLSMFFSSVTGTISGGGFRPSSITVMTGGVLTTYDNLLDSMDGEEWDTLNLNVNIPAGASMLTVQALSVDNLGTGLGPASFGWSAAGLSVPPEDEGLCWITGGGFIDLVDNNSAGSKSFTFGGNVGPPPHGSWQVVDHDTGDKFHAHTVSIVSCEVLPDTTGPGQPGGKKGFDKNKANFTGIGSLNGQDGCPFDGYVIDGGEPQGKKSNSNDYFHLETTDSAACGGSFVASGEMPGGNFQIHPPKD